MTNYVIYYTKFGKQITQFRDFPGHFNVASAYFISYIAMLNSDSMLGIKIEYRLYDLGM